MLTDIFEKEKALFEDGAQTVLRAQENRNRAVRILKGNITANSRNESRGISARVGRDGLFGFAPNEDVLIVDNCIPIWDGFATLTAYWKDYEGEGKNKMQTELKNNYQFFNTLIQIEISITYPFLFISNSELI